MTPARSSLAVLAALLSAWAAVASGCTTTGGPSAQATVPAEPTDEGAVDPGAEGAGGDAGPSSPNKVCHTGGFACTDGTPCCAGVCGSSGKCEPADGSTCKKFGEDCSKLPCCQGTTCTKLSVGSRCTLTATCTKDGGACADDGNCCGGLTCQAGRCAGAPRVKSCRIYGERCGAVDCCPSDMGCSNRLCCMSADFAGTTCGSDAVCCTGLCKGGLCDASPSGGRCEVYDDCGGDGTGHVCVDHACCGETRADCTKPSDCCSGSCVSGECACLPKGSPSKTSASCCSKFLAGGVCQ